MGYRYDCPRPAPRTSGAGDPPTGFALEFVAPALAPDPSKRYNDLFQVSDREILVYGNGENRLCKRIGVRKHLPVEKRITPRPKGDGLDSALLQSSAEVCLIRDTEGEGEGTHPLRKVGPDQAYSFNAV